MYLLQELANRTNYLFDIIFIQCSGGKRQFIPVLMNHKATLVDITDYASSVTELTTHNGYKSFMTC